MYILELFFKLKEKIKDKGGFKPFLNDILRPAKPDIETDTTDEKCEHIFSAIDSTNTVLACVKCGYLIHCESNEFKKKNIFENSGNDTPTQQ